MKFLERVEMLLFGAFLAFGTAYFGWVSDFDSAGFWVMGALVLLWAFKAMFTKEKQTDMFDSADKLKDPSNG